MDRPSFRRANPAARFSGKTSPRRTGADHNPPKKEQAIYNSGDDYLSPGAQNLLTLNLPSVARGILPRVTRSPQPESKAAATMPPILNLPRGQVLQPLNQSRFNDRVENDSVSRSSYNNHRSQVGSFRSSLGYNFNRSLLRDLEFGEMPNPVNSKSEARSASGEPTPQLGKRVSHVLTFREESEEEETEPQAVQGKSKRKSSNSKVNTPVVPPKAQAKTKSGPTKEDALSPDKQPQLTPQEMLDKMYYGQSNPIKIEEVDIETDETANIVVLENFKRQLESKMIYQSQKYRITNLYYKKIQTLLRLGDLEISVASLLIDQLNWGEFADGDTRLLNIPDLREVYIHFFSEQPKPEDLNIFYQLFFTLIFSKKHLNSSLTIHVDSETLDRRFYTELHNAYKIWQHTLTVDLSALSCVRLNERFNRLKRPALEAHRRRDLQAVLDLVFAPGRTGDGAETPAVYLRGAGTYKASRAGQRNKAW